LAKTNQESACPELRSNPFNPGTHRLPSTGRAARLGGLAACPRCGRGWSLHPNAADGALAALIDWSISASSSWLLPRCAPAPGFARHNLVNRPGIVSLVLYLVIAWGVQNYYRWNIVPNVECAGESSGLRYKFGRRSGRKSAFCADL